MSGDEALSIIGEWLCTRTNTCTCSTGRFPGAHEPYCGWEALVKVADVQRALSASRPEASMSEHTALDLDAIEARLRAVNHWPANIVPDEQDALVDKDVPALLAEVKRLRAQVERVEALTYASDDGTEYEHVDDCGLEAWCPACWATDLRAALSTTEEADRG